jgi:hypothetical protein
MRPHAAQHSLGDWPEKTQKPRPIPQKAPVAMDEGTYAGVSPTIFSTIFLILVVFSTSLWQ